MENRINKKSFVVYCDIQNIVESMTDSEAGLFFKAMLDYGNTGEARELPEKLVFLFMSTKNQMDRDSEKYRNICERNRLNGKKGGRPRKPKKPTGLSGNPKNPSEPKKADSDIDNDIDNDNDIDFKNKWDTPQKLREDKPTLAKIAKDCDVPVSYVLTMVGRAENYVKSHGVTYKDYNAAVRNYISRAEERGEVPKTPKTFMDKFNEAQSI